MGRKCEVLSCSEGWGALGSRRGACVTVVRGTEVGSIGHRIRRRATVQQKVFPERGSPGEALTSSP